MVNQVVDERCYFLSRIKSDNANIDLMLEEGYKALDQNDLSGLNKAAAGCMHKLGGIKFHWQNAANQRYGKRHVAMLKSEADRVYQIQSERVKDLASEIESLMALTAFRNEHLYIETDGGREDSGRDNSHTGDCGVRALSLATNSTYNRVWAELDALLPYNQSPDHGVSLSIITEFLTRRKWVSYSVEGLTVVDFARDGKLAVLDCQLSDYRHAICVKYGKFYDITSNPAGWLVNRVFYPESYGHKEGDLITTLDWIKRQTIAIS